MGTFLLLLLGIFVLVVYLKSKSSDTARSEPPSTVFRSVHGISIDTMANTISLRDARGKTATLNKDQIVSWKLTYDLAGSKPHNTHLYIGTNDLNKPNWDVRFSGHGTLLNTQEKRNLVDAQEWEARISAWVNHN